MIDWISTFVFSGFAPFVEIQKEMEKMRLENEKNQKNLKNHKNKLISELVNLDKTEIANTIHEEKKYSLWERIMKTLGIS